MRAQVSGDADQVAVVTSQVVRFYDELWNGPDLTLISELLHPEITFRGSLGDERVGHDEFADYVNTVTRALDRYHCQIVQLIAEADRAAARTVFTGIHRSRFLGVEPTGAQVSWAGAAFFSFHGHLVRDLWVLGDLAGLQAQLRAASGS